MMDLTRTRVLSRRMPAHPSHTLRARRAVLTSSVALVLTCSFVFLVCSFNPKNKSLEATQPGYVARQRFSKPSVAFCGLSRPVIARANPISEWMGKLASDSPQSTTNPLADWIANLSNPQPKADPLKDLKTELLDSLEGLNEGARQTEEQKQIVLKLVQQIKEKVGSEFGSDIVSKATFNGRWKLIWTTEKETLTFRKAGFFGKPFKAAYQDIDVVSGKLQNLIEFQDGYFSLMSALSADESDPNRCNFKFTSAAAKWGNFGPFTLPPFGKGWFETVYMDNDMRIAEDIRGDTLIVVKDAAGSPFSVPE